MVRLACVELPALPLQIVFQRFPDWTPQPVAVVTDRGPQGKILWANSRAQRQGIQPGMRFTTAITYVPTLRTAVVTGSELTQAVKDVTILLQQFSPVVEPAQAEPGSFWLEAMGMLRLYASFSTWGQAIVATLQQAGWQAHVVVGFSRFATCAVARSTQHSVIVFANGEEEARAVHEVPLTCFPLTPQVNTTLSQLDIRTVGSLLQLPRGALRERFGQELTHLVHDAISTDKLPLRPARIEEPLATNVDLETPESNQTRLVFFFRRILHPLLRTLQTRYQAVTELRWTFTLDDHTQHDDQLRPAAPTLNDSQLIDLVRMRLETLNLSAGVTRVKLTIDSCTASDEQLRLFSSNYRRDYAAANRTLARVRATFGPHTVRRARLRAGHLPEAQFVREALDEVAQPHPCLVPELILVRRLLTQPLTLLSPPTFALLFADGPAAVARTEEIAGRCSFSLAELQYRYPLERLSDGISATPWLRHLTIQGARQRYGQDVPTEVTVQIEKELFLITELQYEGTFLRCPKSLSFVGEKAFCVKDVGRRQIQRYVIAWGLLRSIRYVWVCCLSAFSRVSALNLRTLTSILPMNDERRLFSRCMPNIIARTPQGSPTSFAIVLDRAVRDVGKVLGLPATTLTRVAKLLPHYGTVAEAVLTQAGLDPGIPVHRHLLRVRVHDVVDPDTY